MSKDKEEVRPIDIPKRPEARWVALDKHDQIISEGKTPSEVLTKAKLLASDFILMFVPAQGNIYIF
jgi:hypothetical protein